MEVSTILCILLLSLYLLLAVFWIVRSIIDIIDDHKRDKRNEAWEAERQQMERVRCAGGTLCVLARRSTDRADRRDPGPDCF